MIRFISEDDIEKIHQKTLYLLETVGCQFQLPFHLFNKRAF